MTHRSLFQPLPFCDSVSGAASSLGSSCRCGDRCGPESQDLLLPKFTSAFAGPCWSVQTAYRQGEAGFHPNERATVVTANPVSFQPILSWHGR